MSVSKEKTATAYGEVEYETVECSSCGNSVPKQSAKRHVVGTVQGIEHWEILGKREYEFDTNDYQEGWACEYCQNDGVVDFPLKSISNPTVVRLAMFAASVGFLVGVILGGAL